MGTATSTDSCSGSRRPLPVARPAPARTPTFDSTPPPASETFESAPLASAAAPPDSSILGASASLSLGATASFASFGPFATAYLAAALVACLATGVSTSSAASRMTDLSSSRTVRSSRPAAPGPLASALVLGVSRSGSSTSASSASGGSFSATLLSAACFVTRRRLGLSAAAPPSLAALVRVVLCSAIAFPSPRIPPLLGQSFRGACCFDRRGLSEVHLRLGARTSSGLPIRCGTKRARRAAGRRAGAVCPTAGRVSARERAVVGGAERGERVPEHRGARSRLDRRQRVGRSRNGRRRGNGRRRRRAAAEQARPEPAARRLALRLGRRRRLRLRRVDHHRQRRERDLGPPAGRLQPHGSGGQVALPFDDRLGLHAGDADLAELAEMAGERGDV